MQSRTSPSSVAGDANPLLLCRTNLGTALHCNCCGRIEIAFGNAVLALGSDDLASVLAIIDSFDLDRGPVQPDERRAFIIRTQHDDAAFAFTRAEAIELRDLLIGARSALRTRPLFTPVADRSARPDPLLH